MSPTRLGYRELGLKVISLQENFSYHPKRPPMEEEKRNEGAEDHIKLLFTESLRQQRNEMLEKFSQILQRLLTIIGTSSSSSVFGDATPFKVQINFVIPIFEGQINVNALEKWINFLEDYFSVHNFSDRENITFSLLKALPHVKHWWEIYWEKNSTEESRIFGVKPTWDFFVDAVKDQYYTVGKYDDHYKRWTTLHQKWDQTMSNITNTFHTLRTNMGIKYFERRLVLKYHGALHRYIQTKIEFLDISSLGASYRYVVKIE
jgi:hypothetical protein